MNENHQHLKLHGEQFSKQGEGEEISSTPQSISKVTELTSWVFPRDQGLTQTAVSSQAVIHMWKLHKDILRSTNLSIFHQEPFLLKGLEGINQSTID